jgi:hypothetical protein
MIVFLKSIDQNPDPMGGRDLGHKEAMRTELDWFQCLTKSEPERPMPHLPCCHSKKTAACEEVGLQVSNMSMPGSSQSIEL